ncbi:MAG: DUF4286 family protein [Chitinophagaceae bacterium]
MALIKAFQNEGLVIYNVTTAVTFAIATDWEQWMLTEHGPEMVATGCFTKFHLLKLLQIEEVEGPTYAVQYYAATIASYKHYLEEYKPTFQQMILDRWGGASISFSTLMEMVR